MIYVLILSILGIGYYTMTYGVSLYKDKNILAACGVFIAGIFCTVVPIIVLIAKG